MIKYIICLSLSLACVIEANTTLWVSRDFEHLVLEQESRSEDRSAVQLLDEYATIDTTYSGGFVTSINGIRSIHGKVSKDWFYYVNGVLAHVGAKNYKVKPGDIVWWDFHEWSEKRLISSVIGAYPQPFTGGYFGKVLPTRVVYAPEFHDAGAKVADALKKLGVKQVGLLEYIPNANIEYKKYIYLLIGQWSDLAQNEFIHGIHENGSKTGLLVHFDKDGMSLLAVDGSGTEKLKHGAAILSAKVGTGTDLPLWFITGTDSESIEKACDVFVNDENSMRHHAALAITKAKRIPLPYSE